MFVVNRRNLLSAILLAGALLYGEPAAAATARALLVGIDQYRPATAAETKAARPILLRLGMIGPSDPPSHRNWDRLYGSVNDIEGISALLVHRYGFDPANVITLKDEQATRQAILDNLRHVFIDGPADGDTLVFYFSGHGSEMRNSLSADKSDKMDETIVPWDANLGYWDIRDKELARIFNEALDKHPHLTITAIFDSCHSGSIARGLASQERSRSELPDDRDAKDPYNAPAPETRGALILSAAQFDEIAEEADDHSTNPPTPHGVFTLAFMQALQGATSTTPAIDIFRSTTTKIHTFGDEYGQEPVIAGSDARLHEGIFGARANKATRTLVTILAAYPDTKQYLIDGGYALGLQPGSLVESAPTSADSKPIQLTVQSVGGMSQATIVPNDPGDFAKVHKGDILTVSSWAFAGGAKLSLWIPPANLSSADITADAREFSKLAKDRAVEWVTDPTETTPTHVIEWNGTSWELRMQDHVFGLGATPSVSAVQRALLENGRLRKPRLFLFLPPSKELKSDLAIGAGTDNDAVEVRSKKEDAQYWLVGSLTSELPQYTWILANSLRGTRSHNPLAARGDWLRSSVDGPNDLAQTLTAQILAIGRDAAWFGLSAPPDAQDYPYHLEIRNALTQKVIGEDLGPAAGNMTDHGRQVRMNEVREGETYDLILKADSRAFSDFIPSRKAYVFGIDSSGKSTRLFPKNEADDQTNRLPPESEPIAGCTPRDISPLAEQPPYSEICVATIVVKPPLGVDTFFLVTTDQPIGDLSIFEGASVNSNETRGGNPLADLLLQIAANQKMRGGVFPENWSIEHLSVLSRATQTSPEGAHPN